ncbi:helix-turn-helix domain-containing protein [Amycolatopsis sp. Hca4]|uniref:helix-turn-helix domain-containing protein n=1 Tax=unclassified Amycolatopsis TaxID=2618356 RepID=UPI0026E0D8D3|nr:helix-turn-helix domain-containing protein [Amycolatopsis sp. Hca4]
MWTVAGGRTLSLEDVEAQARCEQGWSIGAIARHLGRDRKTIRRYLSGERAPDQVLLTPHSLSHGPPLIRSPDCQQPLSVLEVRSTARRSATPQLTS